MIDVLETLTSLNPSFLAFLWCCNHAFLSLFVFIKCYSYKWCSKF